ncbi:hypothetical protein DFH08DRAFT_961508 [Mycena albidolilacea]|uniref:Uncharacterized protein n=1 Tax=Mycena albidolilacea TaxID=1033008 RepID=A0AAD7A1I6_9AGAR|nr:hypothetical protein DFH08DRAFT_961508 [Mycena albidolilacea]
MPHAVPCPLETPATCMAPLETWEVVEEVKAPAKGKEKAKATGSDEEESKEEGQEVAEVLPPRSSRRSKPMEEEDVEEELLASVKGKGKAAPKPASWSALKSAAKVTPKPATKPVLKPSAKVLKVGKTAAPNWKNPFSRSSDEFFNKDNGEEEGKPAPVVAKVGKTSAQKRKACSGEDSAEISSKFFNFNDHDDEAEEEEETTLPPTKKAQLVGPSNTSQKSQAMQEGGGRSSKGLKYVTFASGGNTNNPVILAEWCQRMNTIPPPESQAGPSGHAPRGPHVAGPSAAPGELAAILGQLANASSTQLSTIMSTLKFNNMPPLS